MLTKKRKVRTSRVQEEWAARLGTSALNPLEAMEFQDAIRARKKKVKLADGREFRLSYHRPGTVYYAPTTDGVFVPSGYLDIERFLEGY